MVSITNNQSFPSIHTEKQNDAVISIVAGKGTNPFIDDGRRAVYMPTSYSTDGAYEKSCMLQDGVVFQPPVFYRESRTTSRMSDVSRLCQSFFSSTKGRLAFIITTLLVALTLLSYMVTLLVVSQSVNQEPEIILFSGAHPNTDSIEMQDSPQMATTINYESILSRESTFVVNDIYDIKNFAKGKGKYDTVFINASLHKLNAQRDKKIFESQDTSMVKMMVVRGMVSENIMSRLLAEFTQIEILVLDVDMIDRGMILGDRRKWPIPNLKSVKTLYLKNCIDCSALIWIFTWKFQNLENLVFQYVNFEKYMLKAFGKFLESAGRELQTIRFASSFIEYNVVSELSKKFISIEWQEQDRLKSKLVEPQEDI